jgi:hypothetical protein
VRHLLGDAGAVLLGAVVALCSVAVHRILLAGLPAGLLLAVAATVSMAWALRQSPARSLAVWYAAGWLLLLGAVVLGRPEGDYAVASDPLGYGLLVTGLVVGVAGLSSLARGRRKT